LGVWAGWGGKVQHRIHFTRDENVIRDIMFKERKPFHSHQVRDVVAIPCDEIV
jgi:hypothetical protein